MSFTFPPLQRRVISWAVRKHNRPVFIEQVNILPIGGGLWVPVRNITKQLREKEAHLIKLHKQFEDLKASVSRERKFVEEEINRIGYFSEAYVIQDPSTGEYKEFDARKYIKISLGTDTPVLKKESGLKKVTHTPLINATRPRGENNNKKKGGNN